MEDLQRVIDILHLNISHFKMETKGSVPTSIQEGKWTVSIDLQDAYLHVPMQPAVRKYLPIKVNGKVYQFTCHPFRLAASPRKFTKLLRPVVKLVHLQGIKNRCKSMHH